MDEFHCRVGGYSHTSRPPVVAFCRGRSLRLPVTSGEDYCTGMLSIQSTAPSTRAPTAVSDVSYDDGAWWQELNPGLPDIPITDVIPEHDKLAMASHGRGFQVLDNVGPLRQYEVATGSRPATTERDMVLFDPAVAYRSGGDVLRTFAPAEEGEERDRWAGPALPLNPGLNRVRWDLRTDPAATFPGMILWGVRTMSPAVPPGAYAVRLTVDGRVEESQVEVRRNPWITDVTDEDLVAQCEFGMRIRAQVDQANRAVIAIRRVEKELQDRLDAADDDETLIAAAGRLRTALDEVEGEIYRVRNRSNQDPLNFPIKVNNRLANLLSMSQRGDGRPGSGMYAVFEIMVERLEELMGELDGVWSAELEEVNEVLRGLGVGEIEVEVRRVALGEWVGGLT